MSPFCGDVKKSDITGNGLRLLFIKSLRSKIADVLKGRPEDDFYQLFNYEYQDGFKMLTFGGIIDHKANAKKINDSLSDLKYLNFKEVPKRISIPALTLREKLFLDQKINKNNKAKKLPFEIDDQELVDYLNYANHYPTFHEIFTN